MRKWEKGNNLHEEIIYTDQQANFLVYGKQEGKGFYLRLKCTSEASHLVSYGPC